LSCSHTHENCTQALDAVDKRNFANLTIPIGIK